MTILLSLSLITILQFTDPCQQFSLPFWVLLPDMPARARMAVRYSLMKIRLKIVSDFLGFLRWRKMVSQRRSHWNLTITGRGWQGSPGVRPTRWQRTISFVQSGGVKHISLFIMLMILVSSWPSLFSWWPWNRKLARRKYSRASSLVSVVLTDYSNSLIRASFSTTTAVGLSIVLLQTIYTARQTLGGTKCSSFSWK